MDEQSQNLELCKILCAALSAYEKSGVPLSGLESIPTIFGEFSYVAPIKLVE